MAEHVEYANRWIGDASTFRNQGDIVPITGAPGDASFYDANSEYPGSWELVHRTVTDWKLVNHPVKNPGKTLTERREQVGGQPLDPPTWDDRKELLDLWQDHAPLPDADLRGGGVYDALLAVANWGYRRALDD